MTTKSFAHLALTAAITLTTTGILTAQPQAAKAACMKQPCFTTVVNGKTYDITTFEGSFNDNSTTLITQPWWGTDLARDFADGVEGSVGYPNTLDSIFTDGVGGNVLGVGPVFAYAVGSLGVSGYYFVYRDGVSSTALTELILRKNNFPATTKFVYAKVAQTGDVTAVPTPALLPSLLGMGIAVYRKRKLASSTNA